MALIYKTLVEIKLLHEYFLTRKDGTTIFSEPDQSARLMFLQEEFSRDQEPVNQDIAFEFPKGLQSKYESLGLKLLPVYSGCRVVVRVIARTLTDQSLVFEPAVALPQSEDIFILIRRKSPAYDAYTNARIGRSLRSVYLFLNAELTSAKTFPFLTNTVPVQDAARAYEQGELSLSGTTIQEYFRQGGADRYGDVAGSGFANESDRVLLPTQFEYYFPDTTNLTQASFTLSNSDGDVIANIEKNSTSGLKQKVSLGFSGKVKSIPFSGESFSDVTYSLEVTGNNGLNARHTIVFSDELISTNPWAVIALRPTVTNNAFNLLANDGFLVRRRDASGVWTNAPVFEIPVKSRLAYWRFVHNRGRALDVSAPITGYVNKEGNALVTKVPRTSSRSWFSLRKELSTDTQYVPNPVSVVIKLEADRRLFIDVVVSPSDLFPEVL
jgi:hypothetical protein